LIATLLLAAQADAPARALDARRILVSAERGDDAGADGGAEHPFRSIGAALALSRASAGRERIVVELGDYGAHAGERFPLELADDVEIAGAGSGSTVLDGSGAARLFELRLPAPHGVALSGLSIQGDQTGLALEPWVAGDVAPAATRLVLHDVRWSGFARAIDVQSGAWRPADGPTPGRVELAADGLRIGNSERGLSIAGSGAVRLAIDGGLFESCGTGVLLEADPSEDFDTIDQPGDGPLPLRVRHEVEIRRSSFLGCREAGFRRQGVDGGNDGPAYLFEDCLFRANQVGIELRRPTADAPFAVRRCRFLENTLFGVQATGFHGDAALASRVEDSTLRWNGVGLHLTNTSTPVWVTRSRIVDNLGNGVFAANFLSDPSRVVLTDSLLARNGAAGLFLLADNRTLEVDLVHCTIADNAGAGVFRKDRHKGTSLFELRGSILSGNGPDLVKIGPEEVFASLVGQGVGSERGNLTGDPRFVERLLGDYRLAEDSPCLDRGDDAGDVRSGESDLDGLPRRVGVIDLGALERQL
jgi:hypothetical protein